MALAKAETIDKVVIYSRYNYVKLRTAILFQEDGVDQAIRYHHTLLAPGTLDADDNLVDRDVSSYSAEIQGICAAVWPDAVKADYKAYLIANK